MKATTLAMGRLSYALLTGLTLLIISPISSNLPTIGTYVIEVGIGSALASVLPLGLDRVYSRRIAAGDLARGIPILLLKVRLLEVSILVSIALVLGLATGFWLQIGSVFLFAITRLAYSDIESLWLASRKSTSTLAFAILVNGVLTALGMALGVGQNGESMVLYSSGSTLIAFVCLCIFGRWKITYNLEASVRHESFGFGLSAFFSAVYSRADFAILAAAGVNLSAVGAYGIVTRGFDVISLIRGSFAQTESVKISAYSQPKRYIEAMRLGFRFSLVAVGIAVCGLILINFSGVFLDGSIWEQNKEIFYVAFVSIPIYMAHLPTSVIAFSDVESKLLVRGSLIAVFMAVALKMWLIASYGAIGAVIAIGLCEFGSFIIFTLIYKRGSSLMPALRSISVSTLFLIFSIAAWAI